MQTDNQPDKVDQAGKQRQDKLNIKELEQKINALTANLSEKVDDQKLFFSKIDTFLSTAPENQNQLKEKSMLGQIKNTTGPEKSIVSNNHQQKPSFFQTQPIIINKNVITKQAEPMPASESVQEQKVLTMDQNKEPKQISLRNSRCKSLDYDKQLMENNQVGQQPQQQQQPNLREGPNNQLSLNELKEVKMQNQILEKMIQKLQFHMKQQRQTQQLENQANINNQIQMEQKILQLENQLKSSSAQANVNNKEIHNFNTNEKIQKQVEPVNKTKSQPKMLQQFNQQRQLPQSQTSEQSLSPSRRDEEMKGDKFEIEKSLLLNQLFEEQNKSQDLERQLVSLKRESDLKSQMLEQQKSELQQQLNQKEDIIMKLQLQQGREQYLLEQLHNYQEQYYVDKEAKDLYQHQLEILEKEKFEMQSVINRLNNFISFQNQQNLTQKMGEQSLEQSSNHQKLMQLQQQLGSKFQHLNNKFEDSENHDDDLNSQKKYDQISNESMLSNDRLFTRSPTQLNQINEENLVNHQPNFDKKFQKNANNNIDIQQQLQNTESEELEQPQNNPAQQHDYQQQQNQFAVNKEEQEPKLTQLQSTSFTHNYDNNQINNLFKEYQAMKSYESSPATLNSEQNEQNINENMHVNKEDGTLKEASIPNQTNLNKPIEIAQDNDEEDYKIIQSQMQNIIQQTNVLTQPFQQNAPETMNQKYFADNDKKQKKSLPTISATQLQNTGDQQSEQSIQNNRHNSMDQLINSGASSSTQQEFIKIQQNLLMQNLSTSNNIFNDNQDPFGLSDQPPIDNFEESDKNLQNNLPSFSSVKEKLHKDLVEKKQSLIEVQNKALLNNNSLQQQQQKATPKNTQETIQILKQSEDQLDKKIQAFKNSLISQIDQNNQKIISPQSSSSQKQYPPNNDSLGSNYDSAGSSDLEQRMSFNPGQQQKLQLQMSDQILENPFQEQTQQQNQGNYSQTTPQISNAAKINSPSQQTMNQLFNLNDQFQQLLQKPEILEAEKYTQAFLKKKALHAASQKQFEGPDQVGSNQQRFANQEQSSSLTQLIPNNNSELFKLPKSPNQSRLQLQQQSKLQQDAESVRIFELANQIQKNGNPFLKNQQTINYREDGAVGGARYTSNTANFDEASGISSNGSTIGSRSGKEQQILNQTNQLNWNAMQRPHFLPELQKLKLRPDSSLQYQSGESVQDSSTSQEFDNNNQNSQKSKTNDLLESLKKEISLTSQQFSQIQHQNFTQEEVVFEEEEEGQSNVEGIMSMKDPSLVQMHQQQQHYNSEGACNDAATGIHQQQNFLSNYYNNSTVIIEEQHDDGSSNESSHIWEQKKHSKNNKSQTFNDQSNTQTPFVAGFSLNEMDLIHNIQKKAKDISEIIQQQGNDPLLQQQKMYVNNNSLVDHTIKKDPINQADHQNIDDQLEYFQQSLKLISKQIDNQELANQSEKNHINQFFRINWTCQIDATLLSNLNSNQGWGIKKCQQATKEVFSCKKVVSIIGLPKSGKSTLVNSLLNGQFILTLADQSAESLKIISSNLGQNNNSNQFQDQDTCFIKYTMVGPTRIEQQQQSGLNINYGSVSQAPPQPQHSMENSIQQNGTIHPLVRTSDNFDTIRMKEMRARDSLILKFLLSSSEVLIILIDKFTALEKVMLDKLHAQLLYLQKENYRIKEVIVLHNYFDHIKYNQMFFETKFEKENFSKIYNLQQKKYQQVKYFQGQIGQINLTHLLIPNISAEFGQQYLQFCIDFLIFSIDQTIPQQRNVLDQLSEYIKISLPFYVTSADAQNPNGFALDYGKQLSQLYIKKRLRTFLLKENFEDLFA